MRLTLLANTNQSLGHKSKFGKRFTDFQKILNGVES